MVGKKWNINDRIIRFDDAAINRSKTLRYTIIHTVHNNDHFHYFFKFINHYYQTSSSFFFSGGYSNKWLWPPRTTPTDFWRPSKPTTWDISERSDYIYIYDEKNPRKIQYTKMESQMRDVRTFLSIGINVGFKY